MLEKAIEAARVLLPDPKNLAPVSGPLAQQLFRRQFLDEFPTATAGLHLVDLTGLTIGELKKRVAVPPNDSAIINTAITRDGARRECVPYNACKEIA